MQVWITRPSIWDCLVKGIGRCEMWFVKPFYDFSPRGASDLKLYAHLPRGWRAVNEDGMDVRGSVSLQVGKTLKNHPEIAKRIWSAVCESIEGTSPAPDTKWVDHWERLIQEDSDVGDTTFLFKLELPPDLWFAIALFDVSENGTAAAKHFRYLLECDQEDELPF